MFQSAAMWHVRNYVDVLEKRLVTQYNDYDWVQKQRVDYYFLKKDKSKY